MTHRLLLSIFICLLHTAGIAQTNLLANTGSIKQFHSLAFTNTARHLFILREYVGQKDTSHYYIYPRLYTIERADTQGHITLPATVLAGDTVQTDSTIYPFAAQLLLDGPTLYFFYPRTLKQADSVTGDYHFRTALCTTILDTNLNIIVPERYLIIDSGNHLYAGINFQNAMAFNHSALVLYRLMDTTNLSAFNNQISMYVRVNAAGVVTRQDTVPTTQNLSTGTELVEEVNSFDNHKLIFSGQGLAPQPGDPSAFSFITTDTNFNIIDTFIRKPDFINKPAQNVYGGYFPGDMNLVPLPGSNNLIGGAEFIYSNNNSNYAYTALVKLNASNRYSYDSVRVFNGKDANDHGHWRFLNIHGLTYNATDNRAYLANGNNAYLSGTCYPPSNYLQIISVDTNLQRGWRKFIFAGNDYCMAPGFVTAAKGASGVFVTGDRFSISFPADTSKYSGFIYRVDSSSNLGIGDPSAPITIRNRIATYPNPATDNLTIDDVLGQLASATLTNMQGQLVYQKSISGNKAILSVKDHPPGLYMLRIRTTDGELYSEKIVVQ